MSLTNEVGGVCVHPVEVGRAMHDLQLLGREVGQTVAEQLLVVGGVMTEVDGVLVLILVIAKDKND